MTKRCCSCKEVKDVGEFSKNRKRKDGLCPQCKACCRAYYVANRERIAAHKKANQEANRERRATYYKAWRKANPKWMAEWEAANLERRAEYKKAWREANQEWIAAYTRTRRRTDPSFRLVDNMRRTLRGALKGTYKPSRTMEAVGCTIAELWVWFEGQFKDGMTRENYGSVWHVDHYYPLAKADMTDTVQFRAVWNYRNLRPEFGVENKSKNATVYPEAQRLFDKLVAEFAAEIQ